MPNFTNTERYKSFYTVKEAAELLELSTNTIYTYLNGGNLSGKRLSNRGRFKIPFSELEPFLLKREPQVQNNQPLFTAPVPISKPAKLTGFEVVFGALAGLLLVYSFWNIDFSLFTKTASPTNRTSIGTETTTALLSYSGRTFTNAGNLVESLLTKNKKTDINYVSSNQNTSDNLEVLSLEDQQVYPLDFKNLANNSSNLFSFIATLLIISISIIIFLIKSLYKNKKIGWLFNTKLFPQERKTRTLVFVFVISFVFSIILPIGFLKTVSVVAGKNVVGNSDSLKESPEVLANANAVSSEEAERQKISDQNLTLTINVPSGHLVEVREEASASAKIVGEILFDQVVQKTDEKEGWTKIISKELSIEGWVSDIEIEKLREKTSLEVDITLP